MIFTLSSKKAVTVLKNTNTKELCWIQKINQVLNAG